MPPKTTGSRTFGAFSGVFIPTFLSIIGVILFLRLGYVVGGAGTLGAAIIIILAVSITFSTGLSLSSITSNIKIGAGGAFSIVSKTLGMEVGGSVGIPLFLAQTFSVGLYLFGFTEAWIFLFPAHNAILVALAAFGSMFLLVFISTRIAVKAQLIVFIVVCISLVSLFMGGSPEGGKVGVPLIDFSEIPFWTLFALFFPAVTGLMAGVGMSGELSDPKRQIPKGVLSALTITTVIYLSLVVFLGYFSDTHELVNNNLAVLDLAAFAPLVLIGILAATYSSALTTFVAAPRVLLALGEHSILPRGKMLSSKTEKGEPRNATLITGLIVVGLLMVGSLNLIAPILTMFFLITYAAINASVFIEQSLSLVSFRPTFTIPRIIPLYGAASSIMIMFLINSLAGIAAIIFLGVVYYALMRKPFREKEGDIRSGLFRSISEWAIKETRDLPKSSHSWKPNILIPVLTTKTLAGNFPLIRDIVHPYGSMTVLGFNLERNIQRNPEKKDITKSQMRKELEELPDLVKKFGESGIFTSFSTVDARRYVDGLIVSMEAIESQVFAANIVFLPYKPDKLSPGSLKRILEVSKKRPSGLVLFDKETHVGLGSEKDIHIWISPKTLKKDLYEGRYYDLAMLIAYALRKNWDGVINLWMCVKSEKKRREANRYLKRLVYDARFPESTKINVVIGEFNEVLEGSPDGDIHLIPFQANDVNAIINIAKKGNRSFLFVLDSTEESVLA